MKVKKRDKSTENFNPDNIISSCMNAGASSRRASQIASKVSEKITPGTTTEEIGQMVYEYLESYNPKIAERYSYRYRLRVRTSKTTLENFQIRKIVKSLMHETDLDRNHSKKIAKDVEKELGRLQLNYVTAPLIREIVNVKLLESGFESTRARYTRLGMPVHDVKDLIEHGKKSELQHNPETIQKLMADQISKEYALLNVLSPYLADAHMSAQIHIHQLDHFPTRPFSFSHDLRFFLKNGFRADGVGKYSAISGPPKKPEVAFLQAAKILGASQTNCSGGQALNFFNIFLAPYIRGLDKEEVMQLVQIFIHELSQNYSTQGLFSSICCCVEIPKILKDKSAVTPGGKKGESYQNFSEESELLLSALLNVYLNGDFTGKPFDFPKLEIHLEKKALKSDLMEKITTLVERSQSPYFSIERPYLPQAVCYQNCSFLMPLTRKFKTELINGTLRGGCAQHVSINLPQIAHESKGSEKRLSKLLDDRMEKARSVLLLKKQIIERNLENNLLPFLNQRVKNGTYLNPEEQGLFIGFVGLENAVKTLTGKTLLEREGDKYGKRMIRMMRKRIDKFKKESGLNFELAETPKCRWTDRLSQMNGQKFNKGAGVYAPSYHTLKKLTGWKKAKLESAYHPFLKGGATLEILADEKPIKLMKKVVMKTDTQHFRFILP